MPNVPGTETPSLASEPGSIPSEGAWRTWSGPPPNGGVSRGRAPGRSCHANTRSRGWVRRVSWTYSWVMALPFPFTRGARVQGVRAQPFWGTWSTRSSSPGSSAGVTR